MIYLHQVKTHIAFLHAITVLYGEDKLHMRRCIDLCMSEKKLSRTNLYNSSQNTWFWKSNLNWQQVPAVFVIYIQWWSDDKISCGQFVRRTLSCFHWQCHLQKVGINLHNNDSLRVNTSDEWFSFGFQTLRLLFD